jgi:S-adenosylmethionine:tRNA ribosyltransferase-isomerase
MLMKLEELDYDLPGDQIAQHPLPERDQSRLLVCKRGQDGVLHSTFRKLTQHLSSGDLLILNDTKVVRARVNLGNRGELLEEIFFLGPSGEDGSRNGGVWECLVRPSRRVAPGMTVAPVPGLEMSFLDSLGMGRWRVRCSCDRPLPEILEEAGEIPLPPYVRRRPCEGGFPDEERYQTVYAAVPGSVAAPTAGLHFTTDLLHGLEEMGVNISKITLDVGYGTFSPIRENIISSHRMHREHYFVPKETEEMVCRHKREGGRIIAVGTTVVRSLESAFGRNGVPGKLEGYTDLFIYPGYSFNIVDGLITNFHLPRSTLLALVMAFGGKKEIKDYYQIATSGGYRFFSYGDAMMII